MYLTGNCVGDLLEFTEITIILKILIIDKIRRFVKIIIKIKEVDQIKNQRKYESNDTMETMKKIATFRALSYNHYIC